MKIRKLSKKQRECKCTLVERLVGEGCEICNPAGALEYAKKTIADLEKEKEQLIYIIASSIKHCDDDLAEDLIIELAQFTGEYYLEIEKPEGDV